jgi:thymidylate synthase (FAD)
MNFIEPSVKLIEEKDLYKKIELAGRTCYKSEDKITDDSAIKFVRGLIKRQHTAMLEHAVLVFQLIHDTWADITSYIAYLNRQKFINVTCGYDIKTGKSRYLVSANIRAICERGINDPLFRELMKNYPDLAYGCDDLSYNFYEDIYAKIVNLNDFDNLTVDEKEKHYYKTFRIVTNRGVTHELVRHRLCSFAQESTRYINYNEGLSIVLPFEFYNKSEEVQNLYQEAFECSERLYGSLIKIGQTPQQARAILPIALKTEIVVTANLKEWIHIINLRYLGTTGAPHPDIKVITEKIYNIFKEDKLVGDLLGEKV